MPRHLLDQQRVRAGGRRRPARLHGGVQVGARDASVLDDRGRLLGQRARRLACDRGLRLRRLILGQRRVRAGRPGKPISI
eukprot:14603608-Alexandrium_andersonii.AAC.1